MGSFRLLLTPSEAGAQDDVRLTAADSVAIWTAALFSQEVFLARDEKKRWKVLRFGVVIGS